MSSKSRKNKPTRERARLVSRPTSLALQAEAALEIVAAAEGEAPKQPTFAIEAYNGGPITVFGFYRPVVIDLAGLRSGERVPVLLDHDHGQIVGQATEVAIGRKSVRLSGVVTGDAENVGEPAHKVVQHAKHGFKWSASVGVGIERMESVAEGAIVKVNGQELAGPLWIVRAGRLGEVSFVAVGADETASARVAARAVKENVMNFEEWLKAKGFDAATLTTTQRQTMEAAWQAEQAAEQTDEDNPPPAETVEATAVADTSTPASVVQQVRAELAAEERRVAAIRKLCGAQHAEIAAKAIEDGWSAEKCELAVMRAERPKAPAVHAGGGETTSAVLEAAVAVRAGLDGLDRAYTPQTLDAASHRYRRGLGLTELLLEAARANGYTGRAVRVDREMLRAAFAAQINAAGFSTIDISGILSNVANKFLLEGFNRVEDTWRRICATRPVNDFKTVTSYRLVGDEQYEEVGPGGEIKHGTLGEQAYSNKADTYARMFAITRQDLINDDLGALTAVPRRLGRGAALKINDVVWGKFLNNAAFFTLGNNNYIEGTDTALGINGLTLAITKFRKQTGPDGKPLGARPAILLVPPELEAIALQLHDAIEIRDTTASTKYPTANPHKGKFQPNVSAYLSDEGYPGYSAKAWYLLADPQDIATIEVVFLNGQEVPVIETADADFNTLGVQMRGYHDFGAALQEQRGGVKSKGEA